MKTCTRCKKNKQLSSFTIDKRQKLNRRPECKDCEYLRTSYLLKCIHARIKRNQNYKNMTITINKKHIETLSNICYFCKKEVAKRINIHRLNPLKGYIPNNIAKVHKSCHQAHHAHEFTRNSKGQFAGKRGY